jgi:monothiol glutaredoxin
MDARRAPLTRPRAAAIVNNRASTEPDGVQMPIQQISPTDLKAMIDRKETFEFVDVRTEMERAIAHIDGSKLIDQAYFEELMALPRDTAMVFQCHHGSRSQSAAQHFEAQGFTKLYNLSGGIDAWSQLVDPNVPRY